MFGKPEWFSEKTVGWGLRPTSWKGWGYAMVWASLISLPFIGLLYLGKLPEALVWVVVSIGILLWDVRQVMHEMRQGPEEEKVEDAKLVESEETDPAPATEPAAEENPDDDLFVIDENTQPDPTYYNTRSYDLHWRK